MGVDCADDVWAVSVDWCMNVKGCWVDLAISLDDFSLFVNEDQVVDSCLVEGDAVGK